MLLTALGRLLVPVDGGAAGEEEDDSSLEGGDDGHVHRGVEGDEGGGGGGNDGDGGDAEHRRDDRSRSVRFREGDDNDGDGGQGEAAETTPPRGGGGGGIGAPATPVAGQERAPTTPSPSRRGVNGGRNGNHNNKGTWCRPLLRSTGSAQFYVTPAHPPHHHIHLRTSHHRSSPNNNRQQGQQRRQNNQNNQNNSTNATTAAPSSPARADPRSGDEEPGILVAYGTEQLFTAPALLLLCPFAGLVVVLTFLDQEEWNWRACLERNVRKHVYGTQGAAFAILVMLGLECAGERLVREAFGVEQTVASRIFQRELAFFVVAMGIGLAAIEDTLTEGTSIFATALGSYMIFAGSLHWSQRLPTVMVIAFLWNGLQLIVIAWVGGNVVDGQWTSNWKG